MCAEQSRDVPGDADLLPVLGDDLRQHTAADYSRDYLAHCCWASRQIAEFQPHRHIDFGSYVYFAGIVSAFVPETMFCDIRALGAVIPGLAYEKYDLTAIPLGTDSQESISCLHVLEHIGLGRYGDMLDATGDAKAAREMIRILAPNGRLLIVLPMNRVPRTQFNAHRIYSRDQVFHLFEGAHAVREEIIMPDGSMRDAETEPFGDYTGCFVFEKAQ